MGIFRIILIAVLSVWTFFMAISIDKDSTRVIIPWLIINVATIVYLILK